MAIYGALLALLIFYTDYALEEYALSVSSDDGQWMIVASGWEMLPMLWPALVLAMIASSLVTLLVARWVARRMARRAAAGASDGREPG